jgi:hypothetical protein
MSNSQKAPLASLNVPPNGPIELRIICFGEKEIEVMKNFFDQMAKVKGSQPVPVSIDGNSPASFEAVLGITTSSDAYERLDLRITDSSTRLLLWSGDSEYWIECLEKCAALREAGTGHQYLMVRARHGENIELSYNERPI